jgi:hypothetical protein
MRGKNQLRQLKTNIRNPKISKFCVPAQEFSPTASGIQKVNLLCH